MEWNAIEYEWAQAVRFPFFPISVLVAEAVNFRLHSDGFSPVTFKHMPDNHVCSYYPGSHSNSELIGALCERVYVCC